MAVKRKKTLAELMQERTQETSNRSAYTTKPMPKSSNSNIKSMVDELYKPKANESMWDKVVRKTNENLQLVSNNSTKNIDAFNTNQKRNNLEKSSLASKVKTNTTKPITNKTVKKIDEEKIAYETDKAKKEEKKKEHLESIPESDYVARTINSLGYSLGEIFQKPKEFYDGYKVGELTKTAGVTALGAGSRVIGGIESVANFLPQAFGYGHAMMAGARGDEEARQKWIKATQEQQQEREDVRNKIFSTFEDNSILGSTSQQAIEGVGQSTVFGVAGQANKALGNALMFGQGFGSGLQEAYSQENVEDWQALLKATGGGAITLTAEKAFDLVGEGSKISKKFKEKFLKEYSEGISKGLAKAQLSAVGEGSEEVLESVLNTVNNKIINTITDMVGSGAKFDENVNIEEMVENFVVGYLSGSSTSSITNTKTTEQDLINNSGLADSEKQILTEITQKYNLSNADVQNLIDNTKNGKYAQNQGATIENKPISEQEQQTTLPEGKMVENETSQEIEKSEENPQQIEQNVEKSEENLTDTSKIEYNNVESEGDLDEGKNESTTQTGNLGGDISKSNLFEKRKHKQIAEQQYREWEKSITPKTESELTNQEITLKDKFKKNQNKDIVFVKGDNGKGYNAGGSLDNPNVIYINTEQSEKFGLDRTAYHETMESNIRFADDANIDIITSAITDIINMDIFEQQKQEFWNKQNGEIPSDTAIAKDIICDRFAELNGENVDYNIYDEIKDRIDLSIEYFTEKNSQDEGSILLPENTLSTKQNEPKLLKSTDVDEDIQAFEEETANLDKEQKERSYPKTVIESDFVTEKAKTKAKKVLKDNTYIPISNSESIEKATKTIENTGLDNVYGEFNKKFDNDEKMTLDDLVSAEILIQQYSYRGELDKAQDLIEKVAIVGTELGQMVQALSIIKKSNPLAQLQIAERIIDRLNKQQREKFGKKAKKIELSEETIKAIEESTMDNIEENISRAYAEVGQQLNLTWGERLDNFRYLAMLGNPKTHIRNISGNVVMHYLNNLKNQVSGGIQDIYKLFNKKHEKTNTLKRANRDQRQFAKEDAKLIGDSIDSQGNKYNDKAKNEITENKKLFNNKLMNWLAKKNLTWLDAEDAWALQWAYKDAMQDYMSANNLSSEDLRVQESDDEATIREKTRKLNKAREVAINQALEATFHQYSALANTLNELERKGGIAGGVTKGTTPFKRTPINIAKTGVAYSPAGLIKSISYDVIQMKKTIEATGLDYQEGKITEQQYNEKISKAINKEIDQFSKGLTGSALTAIGVVMAMNGLLKIKAGNEDDEDEFMESLGQQKYSITIGDYNISLDWLSPSAIPLFMGVEMYNSIKQAEEDEDVSILTALFNGTLNSLNPLFETTMLSNVLSTFASYSSDTSGKMGDVLATIALNYVTQYIPSGITNVYKSLDGLIDGDNSIKTTTSTKKDTFEKGIDKFWNQVKYRLPVTEFYELLKAGGEMVGLNLPETEDTPFAKLPEKVDSYGQVQYRNDNVGVELANNLLNPATVNDISDVNSLTTEELTRLNKSVDTNVLPASLDKTFSIDGTSHRMDNTEYADAQKTYGSAYYDAVDTLINGTRYKSMDDEARAELISDIKSYAREKAKVEFAESAGIDYKSENEMYNTLTAIEKAGGKAKDYLKYIVDTYDMESDSEKLEYLNSHFTPKVRNAIYENDTGKRTYISKGEDEKYSALKIIQKGDVSEGYTLYVQKSKEGAFKGENGATGWKAGSKRNKLYDFLNDKSTGLTNIEKYYIATFEEQAKYLLTQSQRTKLRKYLNENKSQIGEKTYNSMIEKLDEAEK